MTKTINRVMCADSYKYSHAKQYPEMVSMYDYMEARGNTNKATVFVGMQGLIKEYFMEPITIQEVNQAYAFAQAHGVPFDIEGWEYIVQELNGNLPIRIKAVPEGSLIPIKNVLCTIESTDKNVPWIAGWMETILMKLWYPTNVATKAYYVKQMLEKYGSPEWAMFAYHNFGDRGCSSVESAAIGGFAHSTQFMGTDNFNSLLYSFNNYGSTMSGYSVFATEHSTTTSWGKDNEEDFVIKMLEDNIDAPIMSFVADSYDVYNFTDFCTRPDGIIRNIVEVREHQKFVLRPDSGNPLEVIPKMLRIINQNGVRTVPNDKILFQDFAILWGDGVTPEVIEQILISATEAGYAAENFVFGSGGDIMQNHTRDTNGFAVKCSSITIDNGHPFETGEIVDGKHEMEWEESLQEIDVFKNPITDPGKKSKKGKVTTFYNKESKTYFVDKVGTEFEVAEDIVTTVYENGVLIKETTLDEIRTAND